MIDDQGTLFSWRSAGDRGVERGDGPLPVLLLHGLMGSRRSWQRQLEHFAAERFAAAWDAPGYGASAPLDADLRSFAGYAEALLRWADELNVERFHLVGLSFGGMIAQHVARREPDRLASLSLLATSPKFGLDGVTTPDGWRAARLAALDGGQQPSDFAPHVMRSISGPNISAEALAGQMRAADLVNADGLRIAIDVLITNDTRAMLAEIAVPTLCLVGELDEETPPAYARVIADGIPAARLVVIAGAGHLLNAEAPVEVNGQLGEHFATCEHLAR